MGIIADLPSSDYAVWLAPGSKAVLFPICSFADGKCREKLTCLLDKQ